MESNQKLRREIVQLSNLIASRNGELSSANGDVVSTSKTVNRFNLQRYPSTFPQSFSLTTGPASSNNLRPVRYPNPFDQYCNDNYVSQVFPSSNSRLNSTVFTRDMSAVATQSSSEPMSSYPLPYKLKNIQNGSEECSSKATFFSKSPNLKIPVSTTVIAVKKEEKPMSIYINRTHLTKVSSGGSLMGLSFAQPGVRPHINPAHSAFQLLNANSSKSPQLNNVIVPVSSVSSSSSTSYDYRPSQTDTVISTNNSDDGIVSSECKSLQQVTNTNTLKTKYKVDRRIKRSPVRKTSKAKIISPIKLQRTKLFQRYSMRVVSASKSSLDSWQSQRTVKNCSAQAQHFVNKKLYRQIFRSRRPLHSVSQKKLAGEEPKSVVHINGYKFITKNGGKTLKRMNAKTYVISINGNRFIKKNGGKSLKRVSESLSAKPKPLTVTSPQQRLGIRLRAIKKSKLTLSQRIWKKKQFCVFYNRLGVCKRKDNGCCPYIHDRTQLMICPKFVVGKCTHQDCKLSHDLKVGRMPPCQFFNKSECSRENCPYPHVKSSPHAKMSSETGKRNKDQGKPITPRKRKLSTRRENSSQSPVGKKGESKKSKSECKDPKARYYEQSPDSQPIESIIPRRFPLNSGAKLTSEEKQATTIITQTASTSTNSTENVVVKNSCSTGSYSTNHATGATTNDDRRMRLMSKISRLHERVKKKESTAPPFLPFN